MRALARSILFVTAGVSPVSYVHSGAPPFLIVLGEDDHFVPFTQAQRLERRLRAVDALVELIRVQYADHGCGCLDDGRAVVVSILGSRGHHRAPILLTSILEHLEVRLENVKDPAQVRELIRQAYVAEQKRRGLTYREET